jgi:hypothetical protein
MIDAPVAGFLHFELLLSFLTHTLLLERRHCVYLPVSEVPKAVALLPLHLAAAGRHLRSFSIEAPPIFCHGVTHAVEARHRAEWAAQENDLLRILSRCHELQHLDLSALDLSQGGMVALLEWQSQWPLTSLRLCFADWNATALFLRELISRGARDFCKLQQLGLEWSDEPALDVAPAGTGQPPSAHKEQLQLLQQLLATLSNLQSLRLGGCSNALVGALFDHLHSLSGSAAAARQGSELEELRLRMGPRREHSFTVPLGVEPAFWESSLTRLLLRGQSSPLRSLHFEAPIPRPSDALSRAILESALLELGLPPLHTNFLEQFRRSRPALRSTVEYYTAAKAAQEAHLFFLDGLEF